MSDFKTFGLYSQLSINTFTVGNQDPIVQFSMVFDNDSYIYEDINKDEATDIANHLIQLFDIKLSDLKIDA